MILVGGMISLSTAMIETGATETLADDLVRIVGDAGPYALLLGLFLLTAALGQLISNMATAPANLMVMGPGGYRFGDYWKIGLPLLLLLFGRWRSSSCPSSGASEDAGQPSSNEP